MTDEYESVIERLREEGLDGEADVLEKYKKNQLREKAAKADQLAKENLDLKEENDFLKSGPKREKALRAAKVDVSNLKPAELKVIESSKPEDGQYTEEWAAALIEEFQLPVTTEEGSTEEAPPAAPFGRPEGPAGAGGSKGPVGKMTITPEQANGWPADKRMRFIEWCDKNGSDAYDRLLQGETVTGVTFE